MPIPKYKGFIQDMKEVYKIFQSEAFTANGTADKKWQAVKRSMEELVKDPTDIKWKFYIDALNLCYPEQLGQWQSGGKTEEEKQRIIDNYNKNYNDHEENVDEQEMWYLHRLTHRLIYSTESMMRKQGEFEQNEKDIDDYLQEYDELKKEIKTIGGDFDKYKDYDDFTSQVSDALKKQKGLKEKLKEVKSNPATEKDALKKLEEVYDTLRKSNFDYGLRIADVEDNISAQEKIVTEAKAEVKKIEDNAERIKEETRRKEEKLKEKKNERQEQLDRTLETKGKVEKITTVIVNARTQQHQVENELKDVDKQYAKTTGVRGFFRGIGGVFSKKMREADKKAREDHKIKDALDAVDAADRLTEQVKTFGEKFAQGEDFSQTIGLGKFFTTLNEKNREQFINSNPEKNKRCLALYNEKQTLEQAMRKMFAKYKPDQSEWDKFNERMKSPEGMRKMAEELTTLQTKDLTQLRDEMDKTAVDHLESKYVLKRESEEVINSAEQEIEGMQSGFKAETNRLSVRTEAVKQQEYEIKKTSLETKLATPAEKYQQEAKKLEELEQRRNALVNERKAIEEKMKDVSSQCRELDDIIKSREELRRCNDRLTDLQAVSEKLNRFHEKANHLADHSEWLKHDKLKIGADGRFGKNYINSASEKLYYSLQGHYETAMVGKKPGHKDTPAYHGMMDRFDALIKDGPEGLRGKKPEEIRNTLAQLKAGAANYIKAKKEQSFQSWRHSPMRKARLNFAEELIKLCDEGTKQIDKVNARVDSVQKKYDDCCKPVVENWTKKFTVAEAMDVIKVNRKAALQNDALKKKSGPGLSAHQ